MMSEEVDKVLCCASCGNAEGDDVKLKKCNGCHLVKYCGIECQKEHRKEHKRECKKRAAELRDKILFKQPESSHHGDCPICFLPLPIDDRKHFFMVCCGKVICVGCDYANKMRQCEGIHLPKCPFCRHPVVTTDEEAARILMTRVEANDPGAICQMGFHRNNNCGDCSGAVEYFIKAAELGSINAHYNLSIMYGRGLGVEKDEKKKLHHLECSVIGGHVLGRYNLGCAEEENGRLDRAVKHWIIAANMGDDLALGNLKIAYRNGLVSKDNFAAALRAHQAALDATKSPQREKGEAAVKMF